jgi:hypothetical protein
MPPIVPMPTAATKNTPERGLYILDFYDATGDEVLVAIGSDGRCIGWSPFKSHTYDQAHRLLEIQLEHADPLPLLRLV